MELVTMLECRMKNVSATSDCQSIRDLIVASEYFDNVSYDVYIQTTRNYLDINGFYLTVKTNSDRGGYMSEITGGELLVRCLHAEGVRFVHGITDGTYMMVIEALERLGEELGIRLIVPRHEAAAAHACDAYTRVTGDPAVVMACAGPGAANLVAGLMCAEAEGSPVIAITTTRRSDISDSYVHQGGMQVSRHLDIFKPAVKWNGKVDHWARIPDMVRHAFRVATSGRPGPVHILIPENILGQRCEADEASIWSADTYRVIEPAGYDPECIRRAAKLLAEADLVNIHCGNGAERANAGNKVRELAEHLGAAVTNTIRARGIISDEHPLCFHPTCLSRIMANSQADVVLAVGTRLGELNMWGRPPMWGEPQNQRLIQIDTEPTHIGLNRPVDVPLMGDAGVVLSHLLDAVKKIAPPKEAHPKIAEFRAVQDDWQKELDEAVADMERSPMLTGQILTVCNEFFPGRCHFCHGRRQHDALEYSLSRAQNPSFSDVFNELRPSGHRFTLCPRGQTGASGQSGLLCDRR